VSEERRLTKWGDDQQYLSAPLKQGEITVKLLSATLDPLGAIAAFCRMYEGKPTYSLSEITDEERLHYWQQANDAHLKAPLEAVDFHFFIEGVDRALTHQMVRTREAVYAQESLRFAVVEDLEAKVDLPPSLQQETGANSSLRDLWLSEIKSLSEIYQHLVDNGVPAEEARGILPHATKTRIHYKINLRRLLKVAGDRLCTQAQFHWRLLMVRMIEAIRHYEFSPLAIYADEDNTVSVGHLLTQQWRPVCYELGHCPWNASFDRKCSIRSRVEEFAEHGVPSSQWSEPPSHIGGGQTFAPDPIKVEEWLLNPAAAR
jgi:flavin-dependent thymidylate synthase